MVRDFYWSPNALSKLRIGVRSGRETTRPRQVRLQAFEAVVAAVFAHIRPDYDWWVTPNRADRGIDFVGQGVFLTSKELGIDAAITIGGQCKKRGAGADVVDELSGSFVKMAHELHPTFFVAAFAAPVSPKLLAAAKRDLEASLQRHCHILARPQIENLIGANLNAAAPIINKALARRDAEKVIDYFKRCDNSTTSLAVSATGPGSVLAGEPFRVRLQVTRSSITQNSFVLKWNPDYSQNAGLLVAPMGADSRQGVQLNFLRVGAEDPFVLEQDLEFLVYAVGKQQLGSIALQSCDGRARSLSIDLPVVEVAENLRPPFYDVPYHQALNELERGIVRARAGKVSTVAIVGAGGAGKTRLCEELCLEARRQNVFVVSAAQAHTADFPWRIVANLLVGLTETENGLQTTPDRIKDVLRKLEPKLAIRASSILEALFSDSGKLGSFDDEQPLLSALAVLIAQRSRSQTTIIHLHDLHWCTRDVLDLIERLVWQLDHLNVQLSPNAAPSGIRVLFLLEGRTHEYRQESEAEWSTRVFERFIDRLACPIARCRAFEPQESAAFARRLFEQTHSANRRLPKALLALQQELIDRIDRTAGGNPFHMLEQVKLLQQHGVIAQNPSTGFMYMVKPEFSEISLPATVLETIEARWRYYSVQDPDLAVLLWSVALVDDNLPAALFRHLWRKLAPKITRTRIESTEFLQLPTIDHQGLPVSFRHENYFQTIRRIQVSAKEREEVVDAYTSWFEKSNAMGPAVRYLKARVALEAPKPNLGYVKKTLRSAEVLALKRKDRSLISRILETLLDGVTWPSHREKQLTVRSLIAACDDEIALCKLLSRSGQTAIADQRIQQLLAVIDVQLQSQPNHKSKVWAHLIQRRLILLTMKGRLRYRDREPAEAAAITAAAVNELNAHLANMTTDEQRDWADIVMQVYHAHSVTLALAGEVKEALNVSSKAAAVARKVWRTSPHAIEVIITFANILLSESPLKAESLLKKYVNFAGRVRITDETRLRLDLNISMARILIAYQASRSDEKNGGKRLTSANQTLLAVFKQAHPLGRLGEAAAAALLLGLISALKGRTDDIDWFSEATALAIRGHQLETLWRAHINLAHSLFRAGQSAVDPALAALNLMMYTLNSYADPDRTPRFNLLSVPMAHAVRYLLIEHNAMADEVLRKFPALRRMFEDLRTGRMKRDRDGRTSHEWLRIGEADYVIY